MKRALAFVLSLTVGTLVAQPTQVLFFLDTEDFTDPETASSIGSYADLFREEGVTAQFAIVGFLAEQLETWGRRDVLASLREHVVGTQTMFHSVHPDICELTDIPDFKAAYDRIWPQEKRAFDSVRHAVFGKPVSCAVPPGNSKSYVAYYVWADLGIPFVCDTVVWDVKGRDLWYCNIRQLKYDESLETFLPAAGKRQPSVTEFVDALAGRGRVVLYAHPNFAVRREFWDSVNYNRGNLVEWGKWKKAALRPPEETAAYFAKVREVVRRLKADPRFELTDLNRLPPAKPRVRMTRSDLPAVRAALLRHFGPIESPASWSVADVFLAVVGFLRGENDYRPDRTYGFLTAPRGVAETVTVCREDLVAAARVMETGGFLPTEIPVGAQRLGPADFLFAAMEVLTGTSSTVAVVPREQLGDLSPFPELKTYRMNGKWVHTSEFEDRYLSDRMRLQLWTLRYE